MIRKLMPCVVAQTNESRATEIMGLLSEMKNSVIALMVLNTYNKKWRMAMRW